MDLVAKVSQIRNGFLEKVEPLVKSGNYEEAGDAFKLMLLQSNYFALQSEIGSGVHSGETLVVSLNILSQKFNERKFDEIPSNCRIAKFALAQAILPDGNRY